MVLCHKHLLVLRQFVNSSASSQAPLRLNLNFRPPWHWPVFASLAGSAISQWFFRFVFGIPLGLAPKESSSTGLQGDALCVFLRGRIDKSKSSALHLAEEGWKERCHHTSTPPNEELLDLGRFRWGSHYWPTYEVAGSRW